MPRRSHQSSSSSSRKRGLARPERSPTVDRQRNRRSPFRPVRPPVVEDLDVVRRGHARKGKHASVSLSLTSGMPRWRGRSRAAPQQAPAARR